MNNRKYLTSTGVLLKSLNEEKANNFGNTSQNFYGQSSGVPQSNYSQQTQFNQPANQSFQSNFSQNSINFPFNANSIFNQPINPMDFFSKSLQNPQFNLPGILEIILINKNFWIPLLSFLRKSAPRVTFEKIRYNFFSLL